MLWLGAAVARVGPPVCGALAGNANYLLYRLFDNPYTDATDFHDITGFHQVSNNNGFYPVTPGYDEATGIGTPNFTGLIAGSGF